MLIAKKQWFSLVLDTDDYALVIILLRFRSYKKGTFQRVLFESKVLAYMMKFSTVSRL